MESDLDEQLNPPDYSLRYETERRVGVLLVHCRGGFCLVNHVLLDRIVAEIKAAPERKVVLDLGAIRFLDSVGIGSLAAILKHTMAKGIDFVLVSNDIVDRALELSGMEQVLRIAHSLEEALGRAAS